MKKNYLLVTISLLFTLSLQAALITDGFDYIESMTAASQAFANKPYSEKEPVYALISMRDFKTYSFDDVYRKMENNIDMKFYMMGGGDGTGTLRLYAMDGTATSTKNSEYKRGEILSADNFAFKNATKLLKINDLDFDAATVVKVKKIDFKNAGNTINPVEVGDIIAFKTSKTSTAGADRIGLIKIININRPNPANGRGTITFAIKLIKPDSVISEGFDYILNQKIGTCRFAG